MAKLLEKLKIDAVETCFVSESAADGVLVRTLSTMLENCVICVPVLLDKTSIERAAGALSKAKKARLNLIVPTSTVQMEYLYGLKADAVLKMVTELVTACAELCPSVEFTAEDATRSEMDFLCTVIDAAIAAGAKTITLCDSTGEITPDEITVFINSVRQGTPALSKAVLSFHLKDNLGLASASALAAAACGVQQIKGTFAGASGHMPLEQFLNILKVRGEELGITSDTNVTALSRTCRQLEAITGASRSGRFTLGGEADEHDPTAQDALKADADISAVRRRIELLGYDVSDDDLNEIYRVFKEVARSKNVVNRDLEALVAETAGQVTPTYQLDNYVINSGNAITATAFIRVVKDNTPFQAISIGDGPIDAAFRAIEQILGRHIELDEFQIQAVTEGREAMGDAIVKLRSDGKLFAGRGLSTDIVGASIRAYLTAVNKIVYEEQNL